MSQSEDRRAAVITALPSVRHHRKTANTAMTTASTSDVLLAYDGAVATLSLNRPMKRNALSFPMLTRIRDRLEEVAASEARVLILRGEGRDFCVGADLRADPGESRAYSYEELASIYDTAKRLHGMRAVTIAAIDGGCAGPGLAWAAACDFRFATERAMFNTAFLNVGVAGEMGLAWSLLRVVGGGWARELLFFPDKFGAKDALRMGLVTRVFGEDELHAQAAAAAERLARYDPAALRTAKANILSAEALSFPDYVDIEGARHADLSARPARSEGFKAVAEKRGGPIPTRDIGPPGG
jgi:2-(1,2-epoxy-1,2-dihydrophenyl)acetyl-CoA isomerase